MSMSSIYLDPSTSVTPKNVGKSIFDQMMDDIRGKQADLVAELNAFREARFPEKNLDDTQTFDPIKDEIAFAPAVTTFDEIEVVPAEEKPKRQWNKGRLKAWKARKKAQLKNYLYEHWGIKFEERP
jgi:uncharacterized protein YozE (UPF0346 family)